MNILRLIFLLLLVVLTQPLALAADADHDHDEHAAEHADDDSADQHAETEHDDHVEDEHGDEAAVVTLDSEQLQVAGIEVAPLRPQRINYDFYAPGEIRANGYTSYIVSPRTDSVVLQRHAALGEHVTTGQPLVTLFSEAVTESQADYQRAVAEWERVKRLGRKAVGDKRYIEARTRYESAQGRLTAFGMSAEAIDALVKSGADELGQYTLVARVDGLVLTDNFSQGQRVEAGDPLMEIADENELWVEARLPQGSRLRLEVGSEAHVYVAGEQHRAVVVQESHTIDPVTRTRVVRLTVTNEEHRLHTGMFADVYFEFATDAPVLAVPEAALMRNADGHWTVFAETGPGEFSAVEVELGRSLGDVQEITGIAPGTRVVTRGAFFVASQIAKGGFDPHNH